MHEGSGDVADDVAGDPASRLCVACGLCCSGAMFAHAALTRAEAGRFASRLPVLRSEDTARAGVAGGVAPGRGFSLPCSAHGPSGCTIYEDRPGACASYTCFLLAGVRSGDLSVDTVIRVVRKVRASIAQLDGAMPAGGWFWDRAARVRASAEPVTEGDRARRGELLGELQRLERWITREVDDRILPG